MVNTLNLTKKQSNQASKKLKKCLDNYHKISILMAGDAPLQALCLPKNVETILLDNGYARIYELFNLDLTKIEGLSSAHIGDLTARLNEFMAMG
jgi:hypothetical protein